MMQKILFAFWDQKYSVRILLTEAIHSHPVNQHILLAFCAQKGCSHFVGIIMFAFCEGKECVPPRGSVEKLIPV